MKAKILAAVVLTGCGAGPRDEMTAFDDAAGPGATDGGPGADGVDDGADGAATGATDGAGQTGDDEADDGGDNDELYDVGAPGDGGGDPLGGEHCTAVDVLFVIDNSPSMGKYQEQLAFAFPTFIDAMWATLPEETSVHVGITTTSFFSGSCSETTMNCATAQTPDEVAAHYLTPAEGSTGVNGEQGRLFAHDGQTYFEATVGADPWPLKIWFAEAAVAAGESGCSYEMSSAGAAYAVAPDNAAANAGFVRDEGAVLAVFFLTDEPDKSPEGAQAYFDAITAAKAGCGGADCVLTAGLVNTCIVDVGNTLWELLSMMSDSPIVGSIDDAGGYADVIGEALADVIGQTCNEITPAG